MPTDKKATRTLTGPLLYVADGYNCGMLNSRAWNIAMRTAHIAAMGVLLGGHAFDVDKTRLLAGFWLTMATGVGLAALEAGPRLVWFHQVRGLMTLAKLLLLCAVPFVWDDWHVRLGILLLVVAIASIGSHMPARLRYYSVIYKRVIRCGSGPGTSQLADELPDNPIGDTDTQTD